VFDLIDQTLLFRADFIGISVGFHMTNTEVSVIIQISTVFSTSEKDTLFKSNVNIEACPIVQSAAIQSVRETYQIFTFLILVDLKPFLLIS